MIGTLGVGTCYVVFIYNKTNNACYAAHLNAAARISGVKKSIGDFLAQGAERDYTAYLIGGWKSTKSNLADDILKWLRVINIKVNTDWLHINNGDIDNSDTYMNSSFTYVALKLSSGEVTVSRDININCIPFRIPENPESLYEKCYQYVSTRGLVGSDYFLSNLSEYCTDISSERRTREFFETIIMHGGEQKLLPLFGLLDLVNTQLEDLAITVELGQALSVLQKLALCVVNPATGMPKFKGFSPLHYAAKALNNDIKNFQRHVIFTFMLLKAGTSALNEKKCALSILKSNPEVFKFYEQLLESVRKVYEIDDAEFQLCQHTILFNITKLSFEIVSRLYSIEDNQQINLAPHLQDFLQRATSLVRVPLEEYESRSAESLTNTNSQSVSSMARLRKF